MLPRHFANAYFYAGTTLIGSDTTDPYSIGWSNAPVGTHTLTAVARDDKGATTTSAPISITIAQSPPKYVIFTASPDHDTNVTSYTVEIFTAGSNPSTTAPFPTLNIGKPAPVNGEITVDVSATIEALPAGSYFITVSATGSGGTTPSRGRIKVPVCETFVHAAVDSAATDSQYGTAPSLESLGKPLAEWPGSLRQPPHPQAPRLAWSWLRSVRPVSTSQCPP